MLPLELDLNREVSYSNYAIQLELAAQNQTEITSVYQLSDVKHSDWAFQAWHSLAKRYDCPTNNFNLTNLNNNSISRAEFAVGLHSCLNQFLAKLEKIESRVLTAEMTIWQRLQTDFATELATLQGTISNLEVRTQQKDYSMILIILLLS